MGRAPSGRSRSSGSAGSVSVPLGTVALVVAGSEVTRERAGAASVAIGAQSFGCRPALEHRRSRRPGGGVG